MDLKENQSHMILSRRELLAAGMAISVASLVESCGSVRDEELVESDPLLFALKIGLTAPNPHNTQAWKVRLISSTEAELYVDEKRLLPETDPPNRQIHIGQGTFIEHFVLGAAAAGFTASVKLFPLGAYGATEIGKKPVARLTLAKDAAKTSELYDAIALRITNRSEYSGPDITAAEFDRLKSLVGPVAGRLDMRTGNGGSLADLFVKAFAVETNTLATNEESRLWFRFNDSEIEEYRDGISLRGNGVSGIKYQIASRFVMENDKAYWNAPETKQYSIDAFRNQATSAKGLVMIVTPKNGPVDWVQAGRAYARLQLAATAVGLASHPMSQILQEYEEMRSLREEFEREVGVTGSEKVQMIARLGRSDYFFRAPRRDLASFLV